LTFGRRPIFVADRQFLLSARDYRCDVLAIPFERERDTPLAQHIEHSINDLTTRLRRLPLLVANGIDMTASESGNLRLLQVGGFATDAEMPATGKAIRITLRRSH
jgi:hypothetical protein